MQFGFIAFGIIVLLSTLANLWVVQSTKAQIFSELDNLPKRDVALVLGTARLLQGGYENPFFNFRIEAAAKLYHSGKVKHLLVSGDNSRHSYNEPADMLEALLEKNIPRTAITLDYAGFRTLDSVVRCEKVFQQNSFMIVSQPFHTPRAVFIANAFGLDAVAFNATAVSDSFWNKTHLRELAARLKAVLDLYILQKKPKYLGEPINLEISYTDDREVCRRQISTM